MGRIHNFQAGPAAIPLPVLEKAREELVDFRGAGMSVMEMSHRGKIFDEVIKTAEANLRRLLGVPDDYGVLFLQGGASLQFAMIPMNLLATGATADYVHSGAWAEKAVQEAGRVGKVNVAWDGKGDGYMRMPADAELKLTPGAAYLHVTSNETIGGVQFRAYPKVAARMVGDLSSDILCRPVDVKPFDLVYAGAQKNLGPSGVTVIILRKELAERAPKTLPSILRYATHLKEPSLYNTPNTWGIYLLKLVTEWIDSAGGLAAIHAVNEKKAATLYAALDGSGFWKPCAQKASRSIMNVTWRLGTEPLEEAFVKEAQKAGLDGLKGHRSVGGIRASLYNAVPLASVEALVGFMKEFERRNG